MKIINANSGSMLPKEIRDRDDPKVIWHYLLKINQPSRYCIEMLQWYSERRRLSVYRFHLALDVIDIALGWTREQIIDVFRKLFHLRYRRGSDHMHDEQGTLSSIQTAGRKTRPYRNTTLYTGKPSKITGEFDAIHFEIKLERKRSVLRVIDEPADLFKLKPAEFFAKEIAIKDIKPILETIIQRSAKAYGPKSNRTPNAETRIRELVRRAGSDHASTFAKLFPYQFERVKHWDCIEVEPVLSWAHANVGCDDEVRELHCLLPPHRRPRRKRLIIRERLCEERVPAMTDEQWERIEQQSRAARPTERRE